MTEFIVPALLFALLSVILVYIIVGKIGALNERVRDLELCRTQLLNDVRFLQHKINNIERTVV